MRQGEASAGDGGGGDQAPRLHEGRIAREGWKRVIEKLGLNPRREIPYIKRRDRTPLFINLGAVLTTLL